VTRIREYFKKSSLNVEYIVITILLISAFLPKTFLPYITVTVTGIIYLIIFRKNFKDRPYLYFMIILIFISLASWFYNFFVIKDIYLFGLFLWWLTYLLPFLVIILVSTLSHKVDINRVLNIYIYILLFEFFIIVLQAVENNKFYGDHIKGTCWDAHTLSVHFTIGALLVTGRLFDKRRKNIKLNLLYLFIFYTGLIMTANKTQIILLFIILISFFLFNLLREIFARKNFKEYFKYIIAIIGILVIVLITVTQTYLYRGIVASYEKNVENVEKIEEEYDIENWPYIERWGGKLYSYKVALTKIPGEINLFFGYGPSTYTSRSSSTFGLVRLSSYISNSLLPKFGLSEERIKSLEKYYKMEDSELYAKYVGKIRYKSTINVPMTSVISIWAELGLSGLIFFTVFFVYLFIRLRNARRILIKQEKSGYLILNQYSVLLLVYFIINLFYLNYWEYPEMVIPVMTFVILSSAYGKSIKVSA
jgi:hypothetical protein